MRGSAQALNRIEDVHSRPSAEVPLVPRVAGQVPVTRMSKGGVTVALVAIALFLYCVRGILLPFVVSGVLAYVTTPLVRRLAALTRMPRWLAATLVAIAIVAFVGGLAALALPLFAHEIAGSLARLRPTVEQIVQWWIGSGTVDILGQKTNAADIAQRAEDALRGTLGNTALLGRVVASGAAGAIGLVVTVVLLFYLLIGGPSLLRGLLRVIPPKQRPFVRAIWAQLDPILIRYFVGLAIVVVYATTVAYVGLGLILHVKGAATLALATGLLETVPVVGPATSAIIAGLASIQSSTGMGSILAYVVYALVLRLSVDQVVSPLILGRAGRVHPVLIIFAFVAGGALFDVVGIILAIPVALAVRVVLATLYEEPLDPAHPETSKGIGIGPPA